MSIPGCPVCTNADRRLHTEPCFFLDPMREGRRDRPAAVRVFILESPNPPLPVTQCDHLRALAAYTRKHRPEWEAV